MFAGSTSGPCARPCPPDRISCSLSLAPCSTPASLFSVLQSAESAYLTSDEGEGRDRKTLRLQANQRRLWEVSLHMCWRYPVSRHVHVR